MAFGTLLGEPTRGRSLLARLDSLLVARRGVWGLCAIIVASLAFRIYVSSLCSLWLDETLTQKDVRKPWPTVIASPKAVQLPLMYVLVKLATAVVGHSSLGLRATSLLFGCLLLVAIHYFCLEFGLSVRRSLLVSGTFALTPFFIRHATEARFYALTMALCISAALFGLRLIKGSTKRLDLLWFCLSAIATALTHYFAIAFAGALTATVALDALLRWRRIPGGFRPFLIAGVLSTAIPLAALAHKARAMTHVAANQATVHEFSFNPEFAVRVRREFSFFEHDPWSENIAPLIALLGLALLTKRLPGLAKLWPFGLGVVPPLGAAFIQSAHFVAPRYVAPSAVVLHIGAVMAVFALTDWVERELRRRNVATPYAMAPGFALLLGIIAARANEYPEGYGAGTTDYRAFQEHYRAELATNTRVIAYPGNFGRHIFDSAYPVGENIIPLDRFTPDQKSDRYVLVELHVASAEMRQELQRLVERHLGIPREQYAAIPALDLPHSRFQEPVTARIVKLPKGFEPPPPPSRKKRRTRSTQR